MSNKFNTVAELNEWNQKEMEKIMSESSNDINIIERIEQLQEEYFRYLEEVQQIEFEREKEKIKENCNKLSEDMITRNNEYLNKIFGITDK